LLVNTPYQAVRLEDLVLGGIRIGNDVGQLLEGAVIISDLDQTRIRE
jgi:hypothetical protein